MSQFVELPGLTRQLTGGPAFSRPAVNNHVVNDAGELGMSLWDYYFGMVVVSIPITTANSQVMTLAGDRVDAMIAERNKRMVRK